MSPTDIDECIASKSMCRALTNSVCVNTAGSFSCQCQKGFTFDNDTEKCDGCLYFKVLINLISLSKFYL